MYIKHCPVPVEVFEECAKAAAPYLFAYDAESWNICRERDLLLDYVMRPEDASKVVKLSPPKFRERARQFLIPEKFGPLPDWFYEGAPKLRPENASELVVFDYGE